MDENESHAIVPVSHELAALGRRPEVKELARRIQTQGPAGMKLTPTEALTLAQYSFSLGANPLIGETWLLKREDRVIGVMPGIRLYRRRADEKDERTGDVRWQEPEIVSDSDARAQLGVPLDARICVTVRLYRRSQAQAYSALAESLSKAGAPWGDIKAIAGTKPYLTGVGYVAAGEKGKMPDYQCALKRAEVHALKQGYHLPFGFVALAEGAESDIPDGATIDEYVLEGQWKEIAAEDNRTPEEKHEAAVEGATSLFGEDRAHKVENPKAPRPKADRPYPPELLKTKMAERVIANEGRAADKKMMGLMMGALEMCFAGEEKALEKRHSVLAYLFGIQSGVDLAPAQVLALREWLKPKPDSGGAWFPDEMAEQEAQAVLGTRMAQLGQEALFGQ